MAKQPANGRNKIVHEPDGGIQPYVVYWVKGRQKPIWRASFSTREGAQTWIDRFGNLPVAEHMA